MDTREALTIVEQLVPAPQAGAGRNWPVSILMAAVEGYRQIQEGDHVMFDRLTEAVSVLTGIPYTRLISAAEVVDATPPLPRSLETQGED